MEKNSPFTRIEILKAEENNKVILKGASSGFDRNQNVSMKLIPGTYVVLIDITLSEFPPPAVASRKVTFSTYGVETTSIQPVFLSKKEMVTLEMLAFGKVIPTITEGWKMQYAEQRDDPRRLSIQRCRNEVPSKRVH
jgi:hypothetical protein